MKNYVFNIIACILICYSCGDSDLNAPNGSKVAPSQVAVKNIRNLNGKSVIYFSRPTDTNFLYLKAVYQTDGEERSANASYFTDSVVVEGFGRAGEYEVKLYSVSAGEAYSQPVITKVSPLTPSYTFAYNSLQLLPTFGGIRIVTENKESDMLTFYAYKKDDKGDWNEVGAVYTTAKDISASVRGIEAVEGEFGVVIKDRWNHRTEMFTATLEPWYEELCDRSKFGFLKIDQWESHAWNANQKIEKLWDTYVSNYDNIYMQKYIPAENEPSQITIDMGMKYKLSRVVIHGRKNGATDLNSVFEDMYPRDIEVWGRNDDRTTGFVDDGTWSQLVSYTIRRADGTTIPNSIAPLTNADKELALAGSEVIFDESAPPVRYVCFRRLKNYGGESSRMTMSELIFYGTPENKLKD